MVSMSRALQLRTEACPATLSGSTGTIDATFLEAVRGVGFNVARLARALGVSPRQFERNVWKEFGQCLRLMIYTIRMRSACGLMLSDASLKEIALELRYSDPAHFCRAFCRFFGESPSRLRSKLRAQTRNRLHTPNKIDGITYSAVPLNPQWPSSRHNGGANILFCDGHVEYAKRSRFVETGRTPAATGIVTMKGIRLAKTWKYHERD